MSGPANTRFSVAVHVLTLLADRPGRAVGSDLAASSVGSNPVHIRRVMANLRRAGIVTSRAGAGGGWALHRPPTEITMADVWDAVHGDEPVMSLHPEPNPACRVGEQIGAALDDLSARATVAVRSTLAETTLAQVHAIVTDARASAADRAPQVRT